MSWLPPSLRENRKAVFNQTSPVNMMEKATVSSVTLGYMGQWHLVRPCFPTAEQPGAGPQPCLLPSPVLLCHITLVTLFSQITACSLLNLLVLCPSATPTLPFSPFPPLVYSLVLLPFLVPLVFINCHATRGCSFESFHVAKWYFSSFLNSLVFLEVFGTCSPHLAAQNSDAFLSLSPTAKQQLNLLHSPLWKLVVITKTIFLDNTVSELVIFHDVFVDCVVCCYKRLAIYS